MGAGQVWKRLLWKEVREGWLVALITLIVPPLVFTAASGRDCCLWVNPLGVAGVQLVIVLYAARKGNAKRAGSEFAQTHLPLGPLAEWTVSLAIPALVFAAVGLSYGYCADEVTRNVWGVQYWLAGALDLSVTYILCFFISQVVSSWAGILVGIAHLLGGSVLSPYTLSPVMDPMTLGFVVRSLLGAAAGSMVFAVLARKASVALRQGTALLVMIAVVLGPPLATAGQFRREMALSIREILGGETEHMVLVGRCLTPDRAIQVEEASSATPARIARIELSDRRTDTIAEHDSRRDVSLLGVLPDRRVILAQQLPGSPVVRILEWNAQAGRVRTAAVINARENALESPRETYLSAGNVDPTGRWVLMEMNSLLVWDADLWAVDLRTGRSEVIHPHSSRDHFGDVGWRSNHALLAGRDYILEVDLRNMTSRELRFLQSERD